MKEYSEHITEEELRKPGTIDKAMSKAFSMPPPPMPVFAETPPQPSYAQMLDDDDLDQLQAAGTQVLHHKKLLNP